MEGMSSTPDKVMVLFPYISAFSNTVVYRMKCLKVLLKQMPGGTEENTEIPVQNN
jgi:hypothetical protein